jgi:pilus assembly protein CpaE
VIDPSASKKLKFLRCGVILNDGPIQIIFERRKICMTAANNPIRVVMVGEPSTTQDQIVNAMSASAQTEFQLVDVIAPSENLVRDIRNANPKLVIVDYQTGEQSILDIIDDLSLQLPEISLIAIIPGNDPLIAQQVMLAGARAFIGHPFTQINLLSTIRRVRDLSLRQASATVTAAKPESKLSPLKTVAVYGPRGGVGCSTIATNMAIALREATTQQVLLLGGKMFFGHLGLMLNVRTNNSIADLIPHAAQLDEGLVREVVVEHSSGIHVLLEPFDLQIAQGIRPQDLYNVMVSLKRMYDFVVIDAGSMLTENTVTLLDVADRIVLVTTPDLASLHDVKRFIEVSHSLDYQPGKMLVALNRSGMQGGVKSADISASLHRDVFVEIPDNVNVLRSLNRGIPLLLRYPRNATSRSIKGLVNKLLQQETLEESV